MEGGPSIQERETDISNSEETSVENTENEEVTGCFNKFAHPRGKFHRFIALIFMCFLGFGSYFCYDNPAALQDHFEQDLNITESQYTILYSVYSWPNVALCFVGGFLIDRIFGIRFGTSLFMGITLVGQLIFATGTFFNLYWLMLIGRFIFGIGAESLAVAQNNYAVLWFKGKELNMVFGLQLSFARIGSTVNFQVVEPIYNWVTNQVEGYEGLGVVLFIATITCIFSMLCAVVLGFIDRRAEKILNRAPQGSGEVVRLRDVLDFKATFWLVTVICVTYYVTIFPFISLAKTFFIEKFHMSKQEANSISSIVYLISGFASPVLGFMIDKTGKNVTWISVAVCATIGSHVLLGFTLLNPYVAMSLMGLAYSTLASSLWPLVSLMIPDYQLGTAYGVCQAVQNLGLAVISYITGLIVENYGYTELEIFFLASLLAALASTVVLWILDRMSDGTLNMTPGDRLKHQQSSVAAEIIGRESLIAAAAANGSSEFLQTSSDSQIRNRYLSRVGVLPPNCAAQLTGEESGTP